jgi:hypothetical protein
MSDFALEAAERLTRLPAGGSAAQWDRRVGELVHEYYRRLLPFWPEPREQVFPDDAEVLDAIEERLSGAQRDWVRAKCDGMPASTRASARRLGRVILAAAVHESNGWLTLVENPGRVLLELFEAGYDLTQSHGAIEVVYSEGLVTVPRPRRRAVVERAAAEAVYVLGDLHLSVERPWPAADDAIAEDWTQLNVYGRPLWAPSFVDLTRRISVETVHSSFTLVDGRQVDVLDSLLRSLGLSDDDRLAVRVSESADPLNDGYLRALRFTPAAQAQPAGLADIMRRFVAEEQRRYASIDLEQRYRDRRSPSPVERLVDAPIFDNGSLDIGFGLLVHGRVFLPEIRLWSRIVHYHK